MKYVLHFGEIDRHTFPAVGGKGANLGEMYKAGFPVPPGFCITTSAYRHFIKASSEMEKWLNLLNQLKPDQLDEISSLGQKIREHLLTLEPAEQIKTSIFDAWTESGKDHAYAVRSSATAEDLPTASFAGQQETCLNVKGPDQLIEAVKKCWASLFTDRAIVYRANHGFDHRSVFLAVVVQQMVFPDVSGIMFTADPVTGHRRTVSIDAGFGLGEALVSGIVTADLYKVRDNQIIRKQIAKKEKGIFSIPQGGTEIREISPELQTKQALPDQKIMELAELGRRIEKHYSSEQDIEWCLEGDRIYIVQSRPITSLYPVPDANGRRIRVYYSFGHKQMMTDYMKPLGISVWKALVPFDKQMIVEAGGRVFVDYSAFMYSKFIRRKLRESTMADDDLLALKKAVSSEEFQKRAPKRGYRREIFRALKPLVGLFGKLIPRLLKIMYFEDPHLAIERAYSSFEQELDRCRQTVFQSSGGKRVRLIQEIAERQLLFATLDSLAYTLAGGITLPIIERKVKKWLDEELSASIHKSPPGNVTSEMGLMIGDLADTARKYPDVAEYLQHAEDSTFYEGLKQVNGGDVFKAELDRFMEKYGMRAPGEIDITRVRWKEAPTMLVPSLLSHLRSNAPNEHREKFKQGEQEANKAIQALLEKVKTIRGGASKAKKCSRLLTLYRNTVGIRELPKYIIIRYFDIFREAILEEANLLFQQRVIENKEDVFYLTLDELAALLDNRFKEDVKELVRSRKMLESHYRKLTPPRVMTSDGEIFTAERNNGEAPAGALVGIPVSAGVTEGYVKVVRRLEEGSLNKGDILVAPYTDPGWTPLFYSAKALVTEIGGMMTHGSVVAREYGIPAVVGVENATKRLKDGQYVRVDGTKGFVEILDGTN
ncbi:phosphoenolpyruvate synthase [Paenactinomyces guangxiensis]|uniref:Phosphoenolpyruvate synthase n=1 Tax=Paenactinomyces guangxiensis TaxID=1490290 RepID=A0A7W2A7B9_9BACL|nr:phosphoenolpyruvate synthase [Paenactinomyces guangxiensis]MBA4493385.1 phosphoenolpyruvate synthase [Paenactinomyces guangxiensis]MBH8590475.1 phosphoenolpyruvate synthase [Paenactinomyces guangxiensis]